MHVPCENRMVSRVVTVTISASYLEKTIFGFPLSELTPKTHVPTFGCVLCGACFRSFRYFRWVFVWLTSVTVCILINIYCTCNPINHYKYLFSNLGGEVDPPNFLVEKVACEILQPRNSYSQNPHPRYITRKSKHQTSFFCQFWLWLKGWKHSCLYSKRSRKLRSSSHDLMDCSLFIKSKIMVCT